MNCRTSISSWPTVNNKQTEWWGDWVELCVYDTVEPTNIEAEDAKGH